MRIELLETGELFDVQLRTDHAASSYGVPVLVVVETGESLGVGDPGYQVMEATEEEIAL